jgi:hypothetical protein
MRNAALDAPPMEAENETWITFKLSWALSLNNNWSAPLSKISKLQPNEYE